MRLPLRTHHRSLARTLAQTLCLGVLGAGLVATGAGGITTATAAPDGPDSPGREARAEARGLLQQMRGDAEGSVDVSTEPATGLASFVRAGTDGDLAPDVGAAGADDPADAAVAKASAYLADYAGAFGAEADQLVRSDVTTDDAGTTVSWQQEYEGIPVFGSLLRAHVSPEGELRAVNGQAVPIEGLTTEPRVSEAEAGEKAVALVRADPPTPAADGAPAGSTDGVRAAETSLVVYREGLVNGEEGGATDLVWSTEVTNGTNVRDMVFFSATTGKLVNRYSMVHDALERRVYETSPDTEPVWEEGDEFPGDLNDAQQDLVNASGESYWFFANAFGRDSYDGEGAAMETVNNDPRISCPNANWNGVTTNYCDGVTSDDVVAHEWGHAYTEYTHGLIYQWQPGALNESYSDIWGETIDLINRRQDEGERNVKRPDGLCATSSPAKPVLSITAPADIAKECTTGGASFGAQLDAEGVSGPILAPTDAVETGGTATDGCSPYEQDVTDQIVIVDRGLCPFTQKAEVATAEGAAALVIGNSDDAPIGMSGDDPDLVTTVSIGLTDRQSIRTALADGDEVTVSMRDASGERFDSTKWLVGEKSTAFGGAIRDMWSPTCYGDPGKVSDVEYKCSTEDSGGVHSNSAVPNHGYALLVDGGTSNGATVRGIGLTKAAAIYYRAMDLYQTPASKFSDHVDALEASCSDLTNRRINELSVTEDDRRASQARITAGDCAQIAPMAAATEMREEPVQCDFGPLLGKDAPAVCGTGAVTDEVFDEDFEGGLDAWTLDSENPFGGLTRAWEAPIEAPAGSNGEVAYGPAPDLGSCDESAQDFSSVDTMTSPVVTVGEAGDASPRMTFRHLVATEVGFDGGNVQVAVNGGDFAPVPTEAFVYNEPSVISTEAEGNTSPLAGQPGFTGTDGGEVSGSWGTSVVDLGVAGVAAGDEMQVRFAIGRDGCGGVDGWYVDDVSISLCAPGVDVSATARPAAVQFGKGPQVAVEVASDTADPTGDVRLVSGDQTFGPKVLDDAGRVVFDLPKRMAVGQRTFRAVYAGDDAVPGGEATVQVKVLRAGTTTTVRAPASVRADQRFGVRAVVDSPYVDTFGPVRVTVGDRTVGRGRISGGEAFVRLDRGLAPGNRTLVVRYAGVTNFKPSQGSVRIRVTR